MAGTEQAGRAVTVEDRWGKQAGTKTGLTVLQEEAGTGRGGLGVCVGASLCIFLGLVVSQDELSPPDCLPRASAGRENVSLGTRVWICVCMSLFAHVCMFMSVFESGA